MDENERKEITEIVEVAKYLADHDPTALMIAKSNIDILKVRSDLDRGMLVAVGK